MKSKCVRCLFFGTSVLALVTTIALGTMSNQRISMELGMRMRLKHTHAVIETIDKLNQDIELLLRTPLGSPVRSTDRQVSLQDLETVSNLTVDNPSYGPIIKRMRTILSDVHIDKTNRDEVRAQVKTLHEGETGLLATRRSNYDASVLTLQRAIFYSDIAGGLLLVSLVVLALLEYRNRKKAEQLLEETVRSLTDANVELKNMSSLKSEFIKTTVHDLKNPLGSICGFADLINEEASDKDSVVTMSNTVKRISEQTLELVSALLQAPALENGRVNFAHVGVDIRDSLTQSVRMLTPMARIKLQKIVMGEMKDPLIVDGHATKLRDVFLNLLSNAIKFSPRESTVTIQSHLAKNDVVRIEITDEGPGFQSDDLKNIFAPGRTLSARPTNGETSTGFGLASVRETIQSHGGRIFLAPRAPNTGACFVIELPLKPVPVHLVRPSEMRSADSSQLRDY